MDHSDHVGLLKAGIVGPGGVWADMGSGGGAFTLALADLIGPSGVIYSVDKDASALQRQEWSIQTRYPAVTMHYVAADYCGPLDLPPLDGIVMANTLHFHRKKEAVLWLIQGYLKLKGLFILIEYNTDRGNPWVPYPISFRKWKKLASRVGFADTWLLATRPSSFLGEIYAAASRRAKE
jgi:ubiquinone/menaquinone biosynthesis C-methylase UbiE